MLDMHSTSGAWGRPAQPHGAKISRHKKRNNLFCKEGDDKFHQWNWGNRSWLGIKISSKKKAIKTLDEVWKYESKIKCWTKGKIMRKMEKFNKNHQKVGKFSTVRVKLGERVMPEIFLVLLSSRYPHTMYFMTVILKLILEVI